jgi:outer membrane protein, heavy metal efflux system
MYSPLAARPRGRKRCGGVPIAAFLILCSTWSSGPASADASRPADPAQATSATLTLNRALRLFREHGFDLLIADAALDAAEADVRFAAAIANPSLSLSRGRSSTYDPTRCGGCSSASIGAGVTDQGAVSDVVTGKRRLRIAVVRAARDAVKKSRADVERTLEFTVKQQLLQAELGKEAAAYAREAQRIATATLDLVSIRYRAGAVSEADVARAEVQKLEADQAADLAEQSLAAAKAGLAYLLGYSETPNDLDVGDDLVRNATSPRLASASRDELLRDALEDRPDLAASRFQQERARAAVDLSRKLRIPDFFPSLQYSQEGRGQNAIQPPTVTLGISATIPAFYLHRGEIDRARADLRTQEVAQQKIAAQIGADVSVAYAAFASAKSRASRMEGQLLDRAARARDLVRLQYEKGAASLFEFLDAQRIYLATQSESLQTLNDYWTAVFLLEQATGMELRQ